MTIDGNWQSFSESLMQAAPHVLLLVDAGLSVRKVGRLPETLATDEAALVGRSLGE